MSLLDTACARVALSQTTTPAAVEDARRDIEHLNTAIKILEREQALGLNHNVRIAEGKEKLDATKAKVAALEKQWASEKELVAKIQELRGKLQPTKPDAPKLTGPEEEAAKKELDKLAGDLQKLQGENPLVQPVVNGQVIAEVVAG